VKLRGIEHNVSRIVRQDWSLKATVLKPLHPDRKPIVVPIQQLDSIASMIDEQEQATASNIPSKVARHDAK
jgi:hypothetical protein